MFSELNVLDHGPSDFTYTPYRNTGVCPMFSELYVLVHGPGNFLYLKMFESMGFNVTYSLDVADIVCFTGGEDINPQLYGEKPLDGIYYNPERDADDIDVYNQARDMGLFLIGICRGGQLLNALNGGKLWQDVDCHGRYHNIQDLATGELIYVSSTHHQQFRPSPEAEVIAVAWESETKYAADTVWHRAFENDEVDYEVLYYDRSRSLCFQPHPEYGDVPGCTDYFFNLITKYYPQHSLSREPK